MIDRRLPRLTGLMLCVLPAPLAAQSTDAAQSQGGSEADIDEGSAIEVVGRREPGAVTGSIAPETRLNAADIRSYGVSSVTALLNELAPQISSDRGRGGAPVVLLNGRRISGMAEIRDIPTEAIRRVDILPEEVALKYGYRADQKVVNFALRRRFRAITAEAEGGTTTEGGRENGNVAASTLHISGDNRINFGLRYQQFARLQESDRDLISRAQASDFDPTGDITDITPYRSLQPATRQLQANAVLSRPLSDAIQATFNANMTLNDSESDQGLPGVSFIVPASNPYASSDDAERVDRYLDAFGPRRQRLKGSTAQLGAILNGNVGRWRWTLTGTYDRSENRTHTDRGVDVSQIQALIRAGDPAIDPFGTLPGDMIMRRAADRARSRSDLGDVEFVASGPVFDLPAGAVTSSVRVSGELNRFGARSVRSGIETENDFARDIGSGQLSLDLPIASRRENVLPALGELSANLNFAADRVSRFGTLKTVGYGINWKPITPLSLIFSVTDDEGAPTVQQLGNPVIVTPSVQVYDYALGANADVTRISGGNPDLVADNRHVMKIGFTLKPLPRAGLNIVATYTRSRTRNQVAAFPAGIAQIEAAFPERFVRDGDGNLLSIDSRPIQYAREDRQQLRWGINFSKPLQSAAQRALQAQRAARRAAAERGDIPAGIPEGGTPAAAQPATRNRPGGDNAEGPGGGRRPDGGNFGGGRGSGGGAGNRLQLAFYHTWNLQDAILIRRGVPKLDLLDGSATGSKGGLSRHLLEVQAGGTFNGIGARISGKWQSGTTVSGGSGILPGVSTGDLRFSSLATLNLRLFANVGQMPDIARRHPWLRGSRLTLDVSNLFNARLKVRDDAGATPISYQPGYVDPIGRSFKIGIRKVF